MDETARTHHLRAALTVVSCMFVSIIEGFDLSSSAISGPLLIKQFSLSSFQLGLTFTMLMAGVLVGATVGGTMGDRRGRKAVLLFSLVVAAGASLASAFTTSVPQLLLARLVAGLGIGGVFPNMLAIAAESVPEPMRGRAITLTNCGGSLGGIAAGLLLSFGNGFVHWNTFFVVGAIGAMPVCLLAWWSLPENTADVRSRHLMRARDVFFADGRTRATLLLWTAAAAMSATYFSTASWFPTILSRRGLSPGEIGFGTIVLTSSAMAGALLLAFVLDKGRHRAAVAIAFVGMMGAIAAFSFAWSNATLLGSVFFVGFLLFGGQLMLYAIVPYSYPAAQSSTALGAATSAGRIGGTLAPPIIGLALDHGLATHLALVPTVPLVLLAGLCTWLVVTRPATTDPLAV